MTITFLNRDTEEVLAEIEVDNVCLYWAKN